MDFPFTVIMTGQVPGVVLVPTFHSHVMCPDESEVLGTRLLDVLGPLE